jgi:hypothetical protein
VVGWGGWLIPNLQLLNYATFLDENFKEIYTLQSGNTD